MLLLAITLRFWNYVERVCVLVILKEVWLFMFTKFDYLIWEITIFYNYAMFSIVIYFKMSFILVMQSWIFSMITPGISVPQKSL